MKCFLSEVRKQCPGILRIKALRMLMFIGGFLFLSGCLYSTDPPAVSASGKQMYNDYCAGCHKASGIGKFFLGVPPSFSHKLSRQEVVRLIREGDPRYPRMPNFPQIRFSQADKIALYLDELEYEQR